MYVNFTPNKGFKLLGSETGAFLADSINNDSLLTIKSGWTAYPESNSISIGEKVITFDFSNAFEWIGVSVPITVVVGQVYSVVGTMITPTDITGATENMKFGVSTVADASSPSKTFQSANIINKPNTVYTATFLALQTTYYVHWSAALNPATRLNPIATIKNEIEIRHATLIGSEEGVELNRLNNATSDDWAEADSTNGFTSVGLDGTGLNVFKTVSNLPYPESNTTENAVSPDGVTEADSTTGFTSVGLDGTGNNLFQTAYLNRPNIVVNGTFDTDSDWVDDPNGTIGGTIVITGGELVITQGSNSVWMGATQAVPTEIGKVYVYQIERTSSSSASTTQLRVGNTAPYNDAFIAQISYTNEGIQHVKFTATATTTYVKVYNGAGATGNQHFDNAKCFSHEKNTNQNPVAPDGVTEANNTTGFTSVGLDGTGGNIFQAVRNDGYPEKITNGGFPTDTSGWSVLTATLAVVSNELEVTTTSSNGGGYQDITVQPGKRYIVSGDFYRSTSTNCWIIIYDGATFSGGSILDSDVTTSTSIVHSDQMVVTPTGTTLRVYCQATGGTGVIAYFDNITCKQSNEYHIYNNAASDPSGTEANATTGFNIIAGTTATSVASPVSVGTYAISAETNTTPTANGRVYCGLEDAVFNLVDGREYLITVDARHNGTGGDWFISLGEFSTGSVTTIATLTSADTTYTTYTQTFTKGTSSKFLAFMETNVANDGGIYIDSLSITEVQVNHGTYAIHAESNDTPTSSARAQFEFSSLPAPLVVGRRYVVTCDAKHVGVGGNWKARITGGASIDLVDLANTDTTYQAYSKAFIYDNSDYVRFQIIENGANDGGMYLDNLSIKESNENHIYRNAANIYDEADSTLGFTAGFGGAITSVTNEIDVGAYSIRIQSDGVTNGSGGSMDLEDSTINLIDGREYEISFTAKHTPAGDETFFGLGSTATDLASTEIITLDGSDLTFETYSVKFTKDANSRYFVVRENNASNDGGIYIDSLSIVETQVNHGNFSIHAEANDTPTSLAKFYMNIETEFGLQDGRRYVMTVDAKHVGVGQQWLVNISNHYVSWTTTQTVATLTSSDNSFATYSESFIHSSETDYLVCVESITPNDGGIYLDNLSVKESNEYHLFSNAASDTVRESNTTTGWPVASSSLITSVTNPVNIGLYALSVESNTTPVIHGRTYQDLNASPISLVDGKQYKLSVDVRHNGTGDQWKLMIGPDTTTNIGGVTIETYVNTDTTYATITYTWIHDATDWRYLTFKEDSGSAHDGGLYVDNLSITEIQVNVGNYAFHAECNDTPTSLARCYVDMETEFGLETGKYYTVEVDAKHVGVGGKWIIAIAPNTDTSGTGAFHLETNLINPEYDTYAASWIYAGEKYLIFVEGTGSQDGGVYIDNLHVHEAGEHHVYSNAAADPAGLEDNSTSGWSFSGAIGSSVTTPVNVGTYAISIESNTTPASLFRGYLDLEDNTINLQAGVEYTMSFDARHNGTGGIWALWLGSSTVTATNLITTTLDNTQTTYTTYAITWTHSSQERYFVAVENSVTNDGGVYIDNLSIRRSDPDHSATGLGLQKFGLLNKHVVNFNADLFSYSGFSAIDYLKQPYNPFLDYGTGDYFYKFWIKSTNASGSDIIFDRYSGSGNRINCWVASDGILNYFTTGGGTQNSGIVVNDNLWNMCIFGRTSGVNTITINNANVLTTPDVGSLTNTAAHLLIGINTVMTSFADATEIALFTTGGVALTNVQKQNLYNSEKYLFQRDAAYAQVSIGIDQDIAVRAINRSTEFDRKQNISLGGNTETLFNRQDNIWDSTTTIIDFVELKYYRLFFDSVVDGQTFTFDPYGVVEAPNDPKQVTYMNNKYSESREGQLDYFRVSFKVRE